MPKIESLMAYAYQRRHPRLDGGQACDGLGFLAEPVPGHQAKPPTSARLSCWTCSNIVEMDLGAVHEWSRISED